MHLEGTSPSLGLSERLLALLPWVWGRGGRLTVEMSLCHTNRGRATNGLFFQSFLAELLLFCLCTLEYSFIHVAPFFSSSSSLLPSSSLTLLYSACLSTCLADLAAVVRRSAGGHAGLPGGQAAGRRPAATGQPGHTLPTHHHTPTERQGPRLPTTKQVQGKEQSVCVHVCVPDTRNAKGPIQKTT